MTTAPTIASSTTTAPTTASTTLTLTKPSGVNNGDLLVILAGSSATGTNGFNSAPAGWTSIQYAGFASGGTLGAYYRVADGSEGATLDVTQTSSTRAVGAYLRITGADPTTPLAGAGTAQTATVVAATAGTIGSSASMVNSLRFWAWTLETSPVSGGFWANYSALSTITSGAGHPALIVSYRADASSGSSGTNTWNFGDSEEGSDTAGFGFSIAPAPDPDVVPPPIRESRIERHSPDVWRGIGKRSPLNAQDFVPPPWSVPPSRRALQQRPPGDVVQGRSIRPEWAPLADPYFPPSAPPYRVHLQHPPPPDVVRGRSRRSPPVPVLEFLRRELSLRFNIDVLARPQFRIVARNLSTGAETVLGTCLVSAPVLSGVSLADGDYVLRVEADGEYWRGARFLREWQVRIAAGSVVLPLPALRNARIVMQDGVPVLHWAWEREPGTATPASFAVFSDPPPTTLGTVAAVGPGGYQFTLTMPVVTTTFAVAAYDGIVTLGPLSVVSLAPASTIAHPSPQSLREANGDWLNP